ncbi:MAG: PD-(D/E)XK nuclease family protein [Steroidobacteraceae bacterium]
MPDSHRAAALRLWWARHQQAAGRSVWASPAIFTWDAFLARQWRAAVQRGATPAAQLLSASQERALWEAVLHELAPDSAEQGSLAVHAAGLIQAAGRATQSLLILSRSAVSDEEQLLLHAITRMQELCAARQLVSLRVALPAALQFLAAVPAPLIVGQQGLTPLQQALQQQCWGGTELLLPAAPARATAPVLRRCPSLEQEIAACAEWCSERLRADGQARLLVISACGEPSLGTQAALLWRHLAPAQRHDDALRNRLLGVEGGEPLLHQALVADALAALALSATAVDSELLFTLLRSPYFAFGTPTQLWELQGWFEQRGLARWDAASLGGALRAAAARQVPAAATLLAWIEHLQVAVPPAGERGAGEWAQRFSDALGMAGFCRQPGLDSREQQRLSRWGELLDELTALDAVLPPMSAAQALRRLQHLAASTRHQAASGDAAITLSDQLADPVVAYDGIWVMGLAETRWPAPPRPDPYVALSEQRRCLWPESGVTQRREQATWALARWQHSARELVLSYAEMEGDLHHRPTSLLGQPAPAWLPLAAAGSADITGLASSAHDDRLRPVAPEALARPLSGGVDRLRIHQQCAFHAQAHWRLGARPPEPLSDGITASLRGRLLHALLQGLWQEMRTQARLLMLDAAAEQALVARHWQAALQAHAETAWLPAAVLERERRRALRLVQRVLVLERARAPFVVEHCERAVEWQHAGARLRLRIDRIDMGQQDERLLLDYKSGAAGSIKLQDGELEPLQLALYVAALAAQGETVAVAALLSLKPEKQVDLRYTGVAYAEGMLPGTRVVEDWDATAAQWQRGLQQLLEAHLAGAAQLADTLAACRFCALPALCRRATPEDVEPVDE